MPDTIREYRGPITDEPDDSHFEDDAPKYNTQQYDAQQYDAQQYDAQEYDMQENTIAEPTAILDESQVESLIAAIEASPLNTNGKTSELAVQAALYLTGDEPSKRERDFIDELVKIEDSQSLKKERDAFITIYRDFSASTASDDNNPQVLQTKYRLKRIISHIQETIDYTAEQAQMQSPSSSTVQKDVSVQEEQQTPVEKPVEKFSIFDSNWFRFAAFAVLAVIILLVIVMFVQWLRVKYELTNSTRKESETKTDPESQVLI